MAKKKQLPKDTMATARIEVAVVHLVKAREQMDAACRDLSSVIGGAVAWKRIRDLSDRIRVEYQKLDEIAARDHRWTIDSPFAKRHGCGES